MKYIVGVHITIKNDEIIIKNKKKFIWVITKKLEKENISNGDIVLVACKKNVRAPVIVLNVFESSKEKVKHKNVLKVLSKVTE